MLRLCRIIQHYYSFMLYKTSHYTGPEGHGDYLMVIQTSNNAMLGLAWFSINKIHSSNVDYKSNLAV